MPEAAADPPVQITPLQAELTAKSNAGVQDTSFGSDFDAEVDAAIARDAGLKPPEPKAEQAKAEIAKPEASKPAKEAKQEKAKAEKPAVMDIPDVLLKKKEPAAEAKPEAMDAEREKMIKEQTAGMSTKAAERFKAIEAKAWAAEQKAIKAERLEKELNETREKLKTAVDSSALEELQKRYDELDSLTYKQAVADHPRFKAQFDAKMAEHLAKAKKLVPAEVAAEVETLMSLPPNATRNRRLNEIKGELESWEQDDFRLAVANHDEISEKRAAELTNWKVNKVKLAEMAQQEQAQASEQRKASIDKALNNVVSRFTDEEKGVELYRKIEGNEDWNKVVDERLANVRKLTEADLSREEIAEMAAWAIGSQDYRKLFFTQRALVQRLQEEVAALKSGEPSLGDGGLSSDGEDDESGSAVDVMVRLAKKAGAVQ